MDSRCLRDLDHLGNRNRRPRAARSGRLYIGFRGDLNPVDTSNPSSNLYLVHRPIDKATDVGCFTVWGVAQIGVA